MRRDFVIRSSLPPEKILDALQARSREWRESAVPPALREHGVYGVQIQVNGSRFRMRAEATTTDRCELRCQGTVAPEAAGSIIRGTTRQDNPAVWMMAIVGLILAANLLLHPSWEGLTRAGGIIVLTGFVGSIGLVARNQARHQAEALEFERILEAAAWPPDSSASPPVAV